MMTGIDAVGKVPCIFQIWFVSDWTGQRLWKRENGRPQFSLQDEASHFGYGDTEIGIKYRFVHETDVLPAIGMFPLVEIPTGDQDKDLGNGQAQYFLPLWLQKGFGRWTTYGGGGYWINPGSENKDYWFSGILLQYSFSDTFLPGRGDFPPDGRHGRWQGQQRL